MPASQEPPAAAPLPERILQLTLAYVGIASPTATALERQIEPFFLDWFASVPYLRRHPGHCGRHPIPGDPLGRSVCWALVRRGDSGRTVILIHHSDTADVQDFGALAGLAGEPTELAARMAERARAEPPPYAADVLADLASGDWLFGRGACDMKGGGAIEMALLERFAEADGPAGNLLLLALPDEENLSAGMRGALGLLQRLKRDFALDYRLLVNTEPHMREAADTGTLYEGSVGKFMPLVHVKGQAAHVGQVFAGFNPILLLAEIVRRTELNPDFLERRGAESTLPPVWLNLKDRKHHYDVSLPLAAAGYLSIMTLVKSPREHLDLLLRICREAFAAVIAQMDASHASWRRGLGQAPRPLPWQPLVRTFDQVHAAALEQGGPAYQAAREALAGELQRQLGEGAIDLPEASNRLVELALAHGGSHGPEVVVALAPPFYPSVSSRHLREQGGLPPGSPFLELAGLAGELRRFARATWGQDYQVLDFFTGLSDLSYAAHQLDPEALGCIRAAMPLWGPGYSIPFEAIRELSLPVLNIGPWGKDFHQNTERVHLPDLCRRTPALVDHAIRLALA